MTLLKSVPNKHVFLHLENWTCRPPHLCSTAGLHYYSVSSHIFPLGKKLQPLWFGYCTWPYCDFDNILINCAVLPFIRISNPEGQKNHNNHNLKIQNICSGHQEHKKAALFISICLLCLSESVIDTVLYNLHPWTCSCVCMHKILRKNKRANTTKVFLGISVLVF